MRMTPTRLILLLSMAAAPAAAQVPPRPIHGAPDAASHRYQADRHRHEMERLAIQADLRAETARRHQADTERALRALETARQPPAPYVDRAPPPGDPAATGERHRRTRETVTQIDSWLDRAPN